MKRSIYFVFGILHFVRQNPGDFAKIEMQNFEKNMYDFQKCTKKGEKAYKFGIFWEKNSVFVMSFSNLVPLPIFIKIFSYPYQILGIGFHTPTEKSPTDNGVLKM